MAMDLYKKIMKNEKFESMIHDEEKATEFISTGIGTINTLFSGSVTGGIPMQKLSMISAPSSLGKTLVAIAAVKGFQTKVPNGTVIWIDTEDAFEYDVAKKFKVDISPEKFIVYKESSIEKVQHFVTKNLSDYSKEELRNVFIVIDSWGGLITSKTIADSMEGKDVKDMTITTKKNALALILNEIKATWLVINHVYSNVGGYGDPMSIPGGTKLFYFSQAVVLGKSKAQDKQGDELNGSIITFMTKKSRYCKERKELELRIKFDGGLDVFYGFKDDALEHGCLVSPTKGFYSRAHIAEDKKFRESQIYCREFWEPIFKDTDFKEYIEKKYSFSGCDEFDLANESFFMG